MASNVNDGTRGLSAGDWIRLKRINGAKGYGVMTNNATSPNGTATSAIYPLNKDISPTNPPQRSYGKALLIPYDGAGTPKTLRTASNWTDYVASQKADYVTNAQTNVNAAGITQTITEVCDATRDSTILENKPALPISNQFNRLKILS
jgi:hypothetical protein